MSQSDNDSSKRLSLTHNFMWTFAGNAVYALCQWAIIVCLAKIGSAEMVGQFALALAIAFPITFIANLQLRVLFVTDQSSRFPLEQILGLRLILGAVAACILIAACTIAHYPASTTALILIVAAAQLIDCISENYYGLAQRHERMDRIARSQVFRSLVSMALLMIIIHYSGSLLFGAIGLVFGRLLVLFTYDSAYSTFALAENDGSLPNNGPVQAVRLHFIDRIRPRWNLASQMRMAWMALPLGASSMLVSLNVNTPRYFIQHFLGSHDLGIYSALTYIPAGCIMTATALGQAVFARLSRYYAFGDKRNFNLLMIKSAGFCASIGGTVLVICVIAGHKILTILYRPEYAEHTSLLLWLVGGAAVGCIAASLGCTMTATLRFKEQVPLLLIVLSSSLVGCLFLIPRWGLIGASLVPLVAMTTQLCGSGLIIHYALRNRPKELCRSLPTQLKPAFEVDRET